jgi:hypothetical protein
MKFYVCFDATNGVIEKVSNEADSVLSNLEIDKENYVKFMQGEYSIADYFVLIQPQSYKKFNLVKKEVANNLDVKNLSVKKFAKSNAAEEKNIFYIIQDKNDSVWKGYANLDEDYKTFLSNTTNYFGLTKTFYITKNKNPNALLGKIVVPIQNFLENKEFTIDETDCIIDITADIAIYANVSHEKYMHVIRN